MVKFLPLPLFFTLFIFYLFLPSYDEKNGFYNEIFTENYSIVYKDGKTPLHFALIKKILEGRPIEFYENETIGPLEPKYYADLIEKDGIYLPNFSLFPDYVISFLIFPFRKFLLSEISLYKFLILINIIFSVFPSIIFYFFARELGLNIKLGLVASLILGLSSSLPIFSKYLFLNTTFFLLFYLLFIYFTVRFYPDLNLRRKLILLLLLLASILSGFTYLEIIILFLTSHALLLSLLKNKTRKTEFFILIALIFLVEIVGFKFYFTPKKIDFFSYAIDMKKKWAFQPYFFSQEPGNAIFCPAIANFFLSLFGERGVIFNSPYLTFSILGIFIYKNRKMKPLIILLLGCILALVSYTSWYGGASPRYIRFAFPIAFILNFFVFYFLEKSLMKRNLLSLILIFLLSGLICISILNVSSLAIRKDWSYEHLVDLVSYDLVLWPWIEPEKKETSLLLYEKTEQQKWELYWEKGCNPPATEPRITDLGLQVGPCGCTYKNWATRKLFIPNFVKYLELEMCSLSAGEDGLMGYIYLDNNKVKSVLVPPSTCKTIIVNVKEYADNDFHSLNISSDVYGRCDEEILFVNQIKLLPFEIIEDEETYNLVSEKNAWEYGGTDGCKAYYSDRFIYTDPCSCLFDSWAKREIFLRKNNLQLISTACAYYAGNDATIGYLFFDDEKYEIKIKSNSCTTNVFKISTSSGKHTIKLTSGQFGNCSIEGVLWAQLIIN